MKQSRRPWFQQFTTLCSLCLLSLFLPNMYPTPVQSRPHIEVASVEHVAYVAQPPAPNPSSFYRGSQQADNPQRGHGGGKGLFDNRKGLSLLPDLAISKHHTYVMSLPTSSQHPQQAAGLLRYILSVRNTTNAGPVVAGSPIIVIDEIPVGLANVHLLSATDWNVSISSSTSPLTMTATYTGPDAVQPGQSLPEIVYSGNLTPQGMPTLLNTARVATPGDANLENNQAADRVYTPYGRGAR